MLVQAEAVLLLNSPCDERQIKVEKGSLVVEPLFSVSPQERSFSLLVSLN